MRRPAYEQSEKERLLLQEPKSDAVPLKCIARNSVDSFRKFNARLEAICVTCSGGGCVDGGSAET